MILKNVPHPLDMKTTVGQIHVGKYKLIIIYDKLYYYRLADFFSSTQKMGDYIHNNPEKAFYKTLSPLEGEENTFLLNIAAVENFGALEWNESAKVFLESQLSCFMPVIQKFMVDASTGTLNIE